MTLLATKTYIPPSRENYIPRLRLIERLNTGLSCKLTLVSAPPGFGKTALVSQWGRQTGQPMAWLSLAEGDNEPLRFWRYVVAALQTIDAGIGRGLEAGLASGQLCSLDTVVEVLIGDLVACASSPVLVLDDYHLIDAVPIHDSLNYLLDHTSQEMHLVICTRADPPLALPRRRARAELNEIRAADLSFTQEETATFLNARLGLALSSQDIARLEAQTEGWIAGLQMAALSLQTLPPDEQHDFVVTFAGDDRYIADYLLEEVFRRQPEHVQSFLLQTSILEQLSGPLCDAMTGRDDGQSILDYLERTNLFVVSLDNRRYWYRYHHLFADLLRQRLERREGKRHAEQMRLKASQWCEREDQLTSAVSYAFASSDICYTADLIERHILDVFYLSEIMLARDWLFALPEELVRVRPLLSAVYASLLALTESHAEALKHAEEWVRHAEQLLAQQSDRDEPTHTIARGFIAKFRVYLAGFQGAAPQTIIELYHKAQGTLLGEESRFQSALLYRLARAHWDLGDDETAIRTAREATQMGLAHNDLLNAAAAIWLQAEIMRCQGRLHDAFALAREGLQTLQEAMGSPVVPHAGILHIMMGRIQYQLNELEEAAYSLSRGLEMARLGDLFPQVDGTIMLAQVRYAQDKGEEAYQLLDRAQQINQSLSDAHIKPVRVTFWLRQAEHETALVEKIRQWVASDKLDKTDSYLNPEQLVHVRALIALHRWLPAAQKPDLTPVLAFLAQQIRVMRDRAYLSWLIELLTLQALALVEAGLQQEAVQALRQALELAEPLGHIRPFLDEGEGLVSLLRMAASHGRGSEYARMLLEIIDGSHTSQKAETGREILSDPLSAREIDVLRLMATGASNQVIADTLFITVSTVKTHVSHIFDKLQVSNRAQAIIRAQQLALFD